MILNLLMKEMTAQETQKKLKIVLLMVVGVRGQAGVRVVQSEEAGIATILHHLMEESTALETKMKLLLKVVVLLMVVGVPGQVGVHVSLDPMDIR